MLQAAHLLCSSKMGVSSHQLGRVLEVQYNTAWFLSHRIREAMRDGALAPIGGNGFVEVDEAFIGTDHTNNHFALGCEDGERAARALMYEDRFMPPMKKQGATESQSERVKQAARELGCDDSEERFGELVQKLAKAGPQQSRRKARERGGARPPFDSPA
jgi:hypothetical protein